MTRGEAIEHNMRALSCLECNATGEVNVQWERFLLGGNCPSCGAGRLWADTSRLIDPDNLPEDDPMIGVDGLPVHERNALHGRGKEHHGKHTD